MKKSIFISLCIHVFVLFYFFGREGIDIDNVTYRVSLLSFRNEKKEILNKSTEIGEQSSPIPAKKEEEKIEKKKKEKIIVQKENTEKKKNKEKTEKIKIEKQLEEEKVIEKEILKKTYEKEVAIAEKKEANKNGQVKIEKNIENKNSETKKEELSNNQEEDNNIIKSKNGVLLIKNNSLLQYNILHMPEEKFPKKARHARLTKSVVVEAIFIVDLEGNTKDIDTKSDFEDYINLGFKEEVEKSISKYKFSPIYYKGSKVEALFYKKFIFKQN